MTSSKLLLTIIFLLISISIIVSLLLYPQMPERMVTHWGLYGEANGYSSKQVGMFLLPIMTIGVTFLLFFIPKLDPLKKNIEIFKKYYYYFLLGFVVFMLYLHALLVVWNLGYKFDFVKFMFPAFSGLFFLIGILIEHSKQNWFIGIRTPWTISNEVVWEKTHKLGSKVFKIGALVTLVGILFPVSISFLFIFIPIVLGSLFLVLYSYFEYSKVSKK